MNWEELRREARKLENEIDLKLVSFSKFGASFAQSSLLREDGGLHVGGGTVQDTSLFLSNTEHISNSMAVEIQQLVLKLGEVNECMAKLLTTMDPGTSSFTHASTLLQQHRGKLYDYTQEFKKTKATITATREHAELLFSVRKDISQFKNSGGANGRADQLLRERGSLHTADRIADAIIGQATETRENLGNQKGLLQGTFSKLVSLGANFPALNNLIGSIRRKKFRDSLILALFISSCICFLIWYAMK